MKKIILITIASVLLQSCMADMRTKMIKKDGISSLNVDKGKALVERTWRKHGFSKLSNHKVYSLTAKDTWRGLMGKMGKPWPEAKSKLKFKYAINTFDSQVAFLNGKRENTIAGLQSWQYYEQEQQKDLEFTKYDKRIAFGLSAYQYFFEMIDRLKRAPIISYAGEKKFNNIKYDLVFITWEHPKPHMEHDQYLLWIDKETQLLKYAVYSLRDNYLKMPGYKAFYGSIKFDDYKSINGILIPYKQTIFLNQPSKKDKRHIHQLIVEDFKFDDFDISELYPNPEIEKIGDKKIKK
ncbi:hypothetical protein [Flavivirga algicola]|uniref:Uncharacterized protein n=1 Tax=Flavivirga algicola TaxID=2729136 RepID=A0ABX1S1B2_9FLAO|nr:hypothetical protein [Flavivirga algicola]NMH89045.1 hypothetical protein [Flavivirga algicola]